MVESRLWDGKERRVNVDDRRIECPRQDNCQEAQKAADVAVEKVFAILGVDIQDPKQVQKFQQDLMFSHTIRTTADKGIIACVWLVFGGAVIWVWALIKEAITKGGTP